jgi:hypothetical protein
VHGVTKLCTAGTMYINFLTIRVTSEQLKELSDGYLNLKPNQTKQLVLVYVLVNGGFLMSLKKIRTWALPLDVFTVTDILITDKDK